MKSSRLIIVISALLLLLGGILFLLQQKKVQNTENNSTEQMTSSNFDFEEMEFDFGVVKQSGGLVTHDFPFTYNGKETRTVLGVPASCGCTSGEISTDTLTPGTTGILTVTFDPNLHAEPEGKFFKTVSIVTDPPLEKDVEVKIWVEINLDLGEEFYKEIEHEESGEYNEIGHNDTGDHELGFHSISPDNLKEATYQKDFFLLDVHIPEQEHIESTDAFIPFNEIPDHLGELPEDKDEKIVVYCRSGGMSKQASQTLIDLGYTNVYDLEGGINAYNK